jgi:hypothetical protein
LSILERSNNNKLNKRNGLFKHIRKKERRFQERWCSSGCSSVQTGPEQGGGGQEEEILTLAQATEEEIKQLQLNGGYVGSNDFARYKLVAVVVRMAPQGHSSIQKGSKFAREEKTASNSISGP